MLFSIYDAVAGWCWLHMREADHWQGKSDGNLHVIHTVFKMGGRLFLQGGLDLDDVMPQSEDDASRLAEVKRSVAEANHAQQPGSQLPRRIVMPDGERRISLPTCPAKMLPLSSYVREVEGHGFSVLSTERIAGSNTLCEALIVAERSDQVRVGASTGGAAVDG